MKRDKKNLGQFIPFTIANSNFSRISRHIGYLGLSLGAENSRRKTRVYTTSDGEQGEKGSGEEGSGKGESKTAGKSSLP